MLLLRGLTMVLSASSVEQITDTGSPFTLLKKQALWCLRTAADVGGRVAASKAFRTLAYPLSCCRCWRCMVLVPGLGASPTGSRPPLAAFRRDVPAPAVRAGQAALVLWARTAARKEQFKQLNEWRQL